MENKNDAKIKLIVISGGGTGGPSTAPLALAAAYRRLDPAAHFLFIGNDPDLEQPLFNDDLMKLGAEYMAVPAGKWRRYFSLLNFFDFFKIISGFFRVVILFYKRRPDLIISAGSYASVPVVWAGRLLGAKILIHQQDLRPGLANRLMAPAADRLTVTFRKSVEDYRGRAILIGNPSEAGMISEEEKQKAAKKFSLDSERPLIFITGGGSGALHLNRLFYPALPLLPADWQIIHVTGQGKDEGAPISDNYHAIPNLAHKDMFALLSLADIVISRAGLGILTELSLLHKATILIPMPNSHQEENAAYFAENTAAVLLNEKKSDSEDLAAAILSLWQDKEWRRHLSENIAALMPADAAERGAEIMEKMLRP